MHLCLFIRIVFKHVLHSLLYRYDTLYIRGSSCFLYKMHSLLHSFYDKDYFFHLLVEFLTEFYSILNKRPNFYID
jgi:hypothetical protein